MHRTLLGGSALLFAAVLPAALQGASTATGVYTDAQATEGKELYDTQCALCHGAMLEGKTEIPALKGRFIANWANAPVHALYEYVSRAMPQMAPGSLSPDDNAKIVAYLLKENGMPAGAKPLPTNEPALKAIAFVPAGPAK